MTDLPTISIVTPCYNDAAFLERTISSVLDQGYPSLQYVVMDGGSTDGSRDIIERHAPRLHDWRSGDDRGQYDAIASGFERTTGEVMGWINADDFYLPWALAAVGSIFAELPEVQWLTTFYPGFCDCRARGVSFHRAAGFSRESFLDGRHCPNDERFVGYVPQESTFWRRSLWERSGGLRAVEASLAGDFELWARFAEHAELYTTTTSLAVFRHHATQRSADPDAYTREAREALAGANRRLGRTGPELRTTAGAGRFQGFHAATPGHASTQRAGPRQYLARRVAPASLDDPNAPWVVSDVTFG